jgi:cytidylate kinase
MAIIAITQHLGTRSMELGRLTAERLGYRLLTSQELVAVTSKLYGVTPEQLIIVDERRPHFWERLKTDTERFMAFFRAVALKEMAGDRLVVIGRSVAHLMPKLGCGMRVRLVGPFNERVQDVMAEEKLSLAVAERRVRDYDREVRARIQTLLGVDLEDPTSFEVVLNTFAKPLNVLAATLAAFAQEIDRTVGPQQWRQMADAALSARIRAALMSHPKIGHAKIEVQCAAGEVRVNGPGLVPPWDNLVEQVVREVDGVKSVNIVAEEQPVTVSPS